MARHLPFWGLLCAAAPALALAQAAPSSVTAKEPTRVSAGAEERDELEVRTLEERVSHLRKRISRTRARLTRLHEMVSGGDVATGSRAVLVHRNDVGSSFDLESVAYALDGAPIYANVDADGDLGKRPELEIFDGRVAPGIHQLSVRLTYRAEGRGLFGGVQGHELEVQSSYSFDVEPGKVSTITVVAFERGGLTTELEDRPAVRYDVEVQHQETAPAPAVAEGMRP